MLFGRFLMASHPGPYPQQRHVAETHFVTPATRPKSYLEVGQVTWSGPHQGPFPPMCHDPCAAMSMCCVYMNCEASRHTWSATGTAQSCTGLADWQCKLVRRSTLRLKKALCYTQEQISKENLRLAAIRSTNCHSSNGRSLHEQKEKQSNSRLPGGVCRKSTGL